MNHCHLHVHTQYSLLDGMIKPDQLAQLTKSYKSPGVAMTDHGNMYGLVDFLGACKKHEIKPIVGCEFYISEGSRLNKNPTSKPYHLVLLAKNNTGLHNLFKLVSLANLEGFYRKPRIDHDLIQANHKGLICLSACLVGEIPKRILEGNVEEAMNIASWYKDIFGEDYYLEIQRHGINDAAIPFETVIQGSVNIGNKLGIKLVATTDAHYLRQSDSISHDIVLAIGTGKKLGEGIDFSADDYYIWSPAHMENMFSDIPDAVSNTLEVCEKIELVHLSDKVSVPLIPGVQENTEDQVLRERALVGLNRRYGILSSEYQDRLDYELNIIKETGFARYMLLVANMCSFAKEAGIKFGPRGSAAASIVSHGLGISEPDPIKYGLIFERFLSPGRIEPPDIDLDFQDDRRAEIAEYLRNTYGIDRVANIATFSTLGPRGVIKDVARVLNYDYGKFNQFSQSIQPDTTIDMISKDPAMATYLMDPEIHKVIELSRSLEGLTRNLGMHAAGIVVSSEPLMSMVPIQHPLRKTKDTESIVVQLDMNAVTKVGLLKIDCLGLDNLTIMDRCLKMVKERHEKKIDVWSLPLDDEDTYTALANGRVHSVFQLGSSGMKRVVQELMPTSINDLMAIISLYRPGPIDQIPHYIARKHGKEKFKSPHPLIDNIVKETHGIIIYQEDVLQIAREVAGYSYSEADVLRKAIGKKDKALLDSQKEEFIKKTVEHSKINKEEADSIWEYFEPFARYGFSKSHSCCYGFLAYQTAWLKTHYPLEYMCSVLNVHLDDQDKLKKDLEEVQAMKISILPPDIGHAGIEFSIENNSLRMGIGMIKSIGREAARTAIDHGPYMRYADVGKNLCSHLSKSIIESLIQAGVFSPLKRSTLLDLLPIYQTAFKMKQVGLWDSEVGLPEPSDLDEVSLSQILTWERELLGTYVTDNPVRRAMVRFKGTNISDIIIGKPAITVGELRNIRYLLTRNDQKPFAVGELHDLTGSLPFVVFNRVYNDTKDIWQEGQVVIIKGGVGEYEGSTQIIVDTAKLWEDQNESSSLIPQRHHYKLEIEGLENWLHAWSLGIKRNGPLEVGFQLVHNNISLMSPIVIYVGVSAADELRKYGKLTEV